MDEAAETHRKNAQRMAHLLAVVVMFADGQLEIPIATLEQLPPGLRLVEHFDKEKDAYILRVGVPAVAEPELEDVPPVDVTGAPIASE